MTEQLKRLHIWVGLFNLSILVVFAVTGIAVTLADNHQRAGSVRVVAYVPPGQYTDKQVADDLFRLLALPLTRPIPEWAIHRNAAHQLQLNFYTPNGIHTVTVLEQENAVRVEELRHTFAGFMIAMHEVTLSGGALDLRVRLWALYVDLSIFSLMFMALTGVWLWLASRGRLWWARLSFAGGAGLFIVLWVVTR